jgi:hypothetical protein
MRPARAARQVETGRSLNPNLTGLDWLRTYIKVMPTSALFLPDFGPSFPQAGAIFDCEIPNESSVPPHCPRVQSGIGKAVAICNRRIMS